MTDVSMPNLTVRTGGVTTITAADLGFDPAAVARIAILDRPEVGHVATDGQGRVSLVLTEHPGHVAPVAFRLAVTLTDGTTLTVAPAVTMSAPPNALGWALGDSYMLETDGDGNLVLEHGDNHRTVHVSGAEGAWSLADIAAAEGLPLDSRLPAHIAKHLPQYGATPDMAVDGAAGVAVWTQLTSNTAAVPVSHWLLFERGFEYPDAVRLTTREAHGESALHPIVIGAYGEGADPILQEPIRLYQRESVNLVVTGIESRQQAMILDGENILLDGMTFRGVEALNVQNATRVTVRDTVVLDAHRDAPVGDTDLWAPHVNRVSGGFFANVDGLLIENTLFDHNGWQDGYDPHRDGDLPQPPSMYSHNLYIQSTAIDVTLRDNVLMRGASFGVQVRPGGYVEDNLLLDNNAGISMLGGNYAGAGWVGNNNFLSGNVITSGAHNRVDLAEGALTMGADIKGVNSALVGNAIVHVENPADPAEMAEKIVQHPAMVEAGTAYLTDDTIVYGWDTRAPAAISTRNVNVPDIPAALLDQVTIQRLAGLLLDRPTATIAELADLLRAQGGVGAGAAVTTDDLLAFFKAGFGIAAPARTEAAVVTFAPDARAEGMRWDNRLNWSTGDVAGSVDGDRVDLAGNAVWFAGRTVTVAGLDFGDHGRLAVMSGKLSVAGPLAAEGAAARLTVDGSGQFVFAGHDGSAPIAMTALGGRIANDGTVRGGIDLTAGEDAQAILATGGGTFVLSGDRVLTVAGSKAAVGFDGAGGEVAVLRLTEGARTRFVADAAGFSAVAEFRSGRAGMDGQVTSGIGLDGLLEIDVAALGPAAFEDMLMKADQIVGAFDALRVTGLAPDRDAELIVDHAADTVRLRLTAAGTGGGSVRTTVAGSAGFDAATAAEAALAAALAAPVSGSAATLHGTAGSDVLAWRGDVRAMFGHDGDDELRGGAADERLSGGAGRDTVQGGAGADLAWGEGGDDDLRLGDGHDYGWGDEGNDTLTGGRGDDTLDGGVGDDRVFGDDGHDRLTGGAGGDWLRGGTGSDTLDGGDGADRLDGDDGDDALRGGADDDRVYGGKGADTQSGGAGDDIVLGDDGNDRLSGDDGDDILGGGSGDDHLVGGLGRDRLMGGAGADTLSGGAGDDTLSGGDGADVFLFGDADAGHDVIADWQAGLDTIRLDLDPDDVQVTADRLGVRLLAEDQGLSVLVRGATLADVTIDYM